MSRRTVFALLAVGALTAGGAALLAPSPASASPEQAVSAVAAAVGADGGTAHPGRRLTPAQRHELRSTGHLTLTVHTRKHGTVTVLVQRGEVTALSPSSISLTSKDGYAHGYTVSPKTKVREKGQPESYADLTVGERVMVVAVQTKDGDVARRIGCLRPAATAPSVVRG